MSFQNQQVDTIVLECPICYDDIDEKKNCVTTECGHTFHCSCLMKNSAVNGFGCPMCRSVMAEEPADDEDDEEDSYYEYEEDQFDDNALTSFRMFHQQLDNEEVELEPEPVAEEVVEEEPEVQETPATIATKLAARGITLEDAVKVLLLEHEEYMRHEDQYERKASELYGEIRRIITTSAHN
jgi:hypothetical protein